MFGTLISTAIRHGRADGQPSAHAGLVIRSVCAPTAPAPAVFEPKFYLLLQGTKRMTIAGRNFECDSGTCAVASVGLPFVSEVVQASAIKPYLSVELKLDAGIVAGLLLDMGEAGAVERPSGALSVGRADKSIVEPLARLLGLLDAPSEIPVLATQLERELYYRLLSSPMGGRLRQIGERNARFAQIKMAVEWLSANANEPMSVEWLASHVGMSLTSFHRHFKAVTSCSPLAYQRQIRLLDARRRLASGTANVTETAFATGYVSASQFSREYKKAFGTPPKRDALLLRRP